MVFMCVWDIYEHFINKYKLKKDTKLKLANIHSLHDHGATAYNFPTYYDISFHSNNSHYKTTQYILHFIFITLIFIDFIYSHIHSQSLLFSSSTLILSIFIGSFIICTITSCFGLIKTKTTSKPKFTINLTEDILIPLCQSFIFILLLFTILTALFYISPPLLLYLCIIYLIKSNPIQYIIEYLHLHDILNMKNMQIDYNFIPYNPMMIDNTKYNAIYQYLFAYILIQYESTNNAKILNKNALNECLQKCIEIISDPYYIDNNINSKKGKLYNIEFSNTNENVFVIQKYIQKHMTKDILSVSIIFVFVMFTFWICFYYFVDINHHNSLYNFYVTTYVFYVLLFITIITSFLLDIENKISTHMGWLKPLYLADELDINNIDYVKFMHCYSDILCVSHFINAIYFGCNNEKIAKIVIDYLYNINYNNRNMNEWMELLIAKHYCYNHIKIRQEQLNNLQFNKNHWLTLKITIESVCDLRYYEFNDMNKIYVKIKMIKPKYINHQRHRNKYENIYEGNNDIKTTDKVKNNIIKQQFYFSLKYNEISYTQFVISIISECFDNEYDDVVGLVNIKLNDVFNDGNIKLINGLFDVQCKNEESGAVNMQFEIMEFNPIYHINVNDSFNRDINDVIANNNNDLVVDDDTVPLIAVN